MKEYTDYLGQYFRIHTPEEAMAAGYLALREGIFDTSEGGVSEEKACIFRDNSWIRIIIRGSLISSGATYKSREEAEEYDALDYFDPRDQLQLLFDLLMEDAIDEIVHMRPYGENRELDAVITRPTRRVLNYVDSDVFAMSDLDRLLFDRTGKWGFYGGVETFGLLGGEPELMDRYIEKAGGMDHIRKVSDTRWQAELDHDGWEALLVPNYYKLAGWDNPPVKRDVGSADD